ncbi:MAG: GspE/PulE family protein [Alphaproteobacteria bacterium]
MDENEQSPIVGEEKGADSSEQNQEEAGAELHPFVVPETSDQPQGMMNASQILAPQKPLQESLNTLKEYQEAPQQQVPEAPVQPEEITAETKLTVEEDPNFKGDTTAVSAPPGSSVYAAPEYDNKDYGSQQFLKDLFSNGNECVTSSTGSFAVNDETRAMLALFSNGRLFVTEDHKYDGRVLGFEYLAKKRRLQIGQPEYVTAEVLKEIYNYAVQMHNATAISGDDETQRQTRMQRDFVTVISRAAINHVSDIHIVVAEHTTVMFRTNGLMQTEMEYNKEWGESFVRAAFASADISDANYAQNEYQAAQKLGRTPLRGSGGRLVLPKNVLGLRLQFNPIAFGSRYVVIRILYADDNAVSGEESIKSLGYGKYELDIFRYLRSIPTGIVIVSGPTGSGKSTTLQRNMIAMLQERNYETNLITVEDPPEYPIPGARQMPVTNASVEEAKDREFTKALSAALRSDPDSLMIGEIRTLSAADLAFRGALSGHNVWTTLHANTAAAVLLRLRDIGVENFKLEDPSIMRGMLAQRLFRRLCPHCRIQARTQLDNPAVQRLREAYGDIGVERAYLRGPGCEECDFHGVSGRTAIAEFILPDATFLDLLLKGESQKAMNYWISDLNGRTLRENAVERLFNGILDIDEVERWTGLINQSEMG